MNIKSLFYHLARGHAKKILTGNLGKVVETDNQLICYIKKTKIHSSKYYNYIISCNGHSPSTKALSQRYNLNKQIIYIIEDLKFNKQVYIFGNPTSEIIIKNSSFPRGLNVNSQGSCTLDNNQITSFVAIDLLARNLSINNQFLINEFSHHDLTVLISADEHLEINNSTIGSPNTILDISSNNSLQLNNSHFYGNKIEIESAKILSDELSDIRVKEQVNITSNNVNNLKISAQKDTNIIYNSKKIFAEQPTITIGKTIEPLKSTRLELIEILTQIKNECEKITQEQLVAYQNILNSQSVKKLLKTNVSNNKLTTS